MGVTIDFTSSGMIDSIKTRALLPTSQNLYTNKIIVKVITEELHADIVPLIMDCREDYFVNNYDQAFTSANTYKLPPRAVGMKLRDVCLLNSNGREVSLPRLEPDQLKHQAYSGNFSLYANRRGFYFVDNKVLIFPDTAGLGDMQLRMKYFRRPNNVCITQDAGQVTLINNLTNEVTLNNTPTSWTTASLFDCIKGQPPFDAAAEEATITAIDLVGKILTFTTIPTDLAVGDWVALAGFSPIAQIPYEVFNILEQRVVIKMLEEMKDSDGLKNAADVYKDMTDKFRTLVSPRADGSPKRIVRSSVLFGGRGARGSQWW